MGSRRHAGHVLAPAEFRGRARRPRDAPFAEKPHAVLQVVDAKNLERMLAFTLQLREAGLPLILVLNIMDEAEKRGIRLTSRG